MEREDDYWATFARRRYTRRRILGHTLALAGLVVGGGAACSSTTSAPTTVANPTSSSTSAAAVSATAAPSGASGASVPGKQILYSKFLANPEDFSLKPKAGGRLSIATSYVAANFNPLTLASETAGMYIVQCYNRLVRPKFGAEMNPYDPWKFEPVGELAESWTASPDGTEYTFKLRQGVKFHNKPPVNGREFAADDAKWTLENIKTDIADTFKSVGATFTAVDKYTLKVATNKKVSWVIALLADPRTLMVPKEVADLPGGFNENIIGTGPFIQTEYVARTKATYQKNPDYFQSGLPYIDGIDVAVIPDPAAQRAAARGGQVLMVMQDTVDLKEVDTFPRSSPDFTVFQRDSGSGAAIWHLSMRIDKAPFNDVRVRRALSMAINRQAITDTVFAGKASILLPFPWTYAYDNPPDANVLGPYYKFDPEGAKQLLQAAGVQPGTTWSLLVGNYGPTVPTWSQLIQNDLKNVGITVTLDTPDVATFAGKYRPLVKPSEFDHLATGIVFTNPVDPTLNMISNLKSNSNGNTDHINDPQLDQLIDNLATELDSAKQKTLFQQIWQRIADQAYWPAIPEQVSLSYWNKAVQNYLPNYRSGSNLGWGMAQTPLAWVNK
jgi:peptide/nickel transport system substrate-binding protein